MTVLEGPLYAPLARRVESAVTKTRDRSSSYVLWIGTDRDPFVFALSRRTVAYVRLSVRPTVRRDIRRGCARAGLSYGDPENTRVRRTRRRRPKTSQKDVPKCSNISAIC